MDQAGETILRLRSELKDMKERAEAGEALSEFVKKWIKDNQVRCGESCYQVDSIVEKLPEFLIGCADIVGYHQDADE